MKKWCVLVSMGAAFALAAGAAQADDIKGRVGITGRIGFVVPSDSDISGFNISTDAGIIGGGGLIYGLTDHVALDAEVTHASYGSSPGVDFNTTDISFGAQYRFINLPQRQLVPYVGGGLDILINGVNSSFGDVDTVVGAHVKGGVDYFLTKELAATAEMKGVLAPSADIHDPSGAKAGNFDPTNFSMTFGMRYFFN
ncbi:MAG TPA: outer membrane beta-barrel protein [Geobacteraceae bacterium]|jgi:outer membrane protein|nr:outer membrane beta-barrel protein [Geobacteraceae bacterium]